MTVRADIAALIDEGHSDTGIAHRLGCHRSTVNRARLDLIRLRTAEERLLAEELPTGRVRDYDRRRQPISPEQAAANYAALAAAIKPRPKNTAAVARLATVYPATTRSAA